MTRRMRSIMSAATLGVGIGIGLATVSAASRSDIRVDVGPGKAVAGASEASFSDIEADFFDALTRTPSRRHATLARLEHAVVAGSPPPRIILLLGLNHLWISAEGAADEMSLRRHSIEAIRHLRRAAALLPEDHRIPSWLHAAEYALAVGEGRHDDALVARAKLAAHAAQEPCFHAVALAITSFDESPESDAFRTALSAMEASFACRGDNPSIVDRPHWPHNVHAFLVALSDFRLKSGDVQGAEMALVIAEARPGFTTWSRRHLVDERLASLAQRRDRFANDDRADDPPFVFALGSPTSCVGCHGR